MNFLKNLIYYEIPEDFSAWWVKPLGLAWGVFTLGLLYSLLFIFGSKENFIILFDYFNTPNRLLFLKFFIIASVAAFLFRLYFTITSITEHDKRLDYKLTDRYILFCISSVITFNGLIILVFALLTILGLIFNFSLQDAFHWTFNFQGFKDYLENLRAKIPTVIHLPYAAAFVVSHLIGAFFFYWHHRLAHESRLLWLLAHRPHHYSTTLSGATVFEADPKFALGLSWRIIFIVFIGGIVSKLFYEPSMIFIEMLLLGMIAGVIEIFNHNSANYEWVRKNKLLLFICMFFGSGPYHYLHHSSDEKHTVANIGGGFFMIMDRLFGTYFRPPLKKPSIGLTHQPEIYMNPINASLAGFLQILYELKNNSIQHWFKILFGGVYYLPPQTKSYLFKNENKYYASDPKVFKHNPNREFN